MNPRYDVCIVGGGAAGLAAAASMDRTIRTCIIEKNRILGRKILATGGGRCNLTNAACPGAPATLDFFASLGLETIRDSEGRYYPYSGCAADVAKILEDAAVRQGCRMLTGCQVTRIEVIRPENEDPAKAGPALAREAGGKGFRIRTDRAGILEADRVILASGGKAAPQFGTTGDGYRLARELGHQVSRLYPILTGIRCGDLTDLKGVRARGCVSLEKEGEILDRQEGEIQFTADGVSGICVFNLTPLIRAEEGEDPRQAMGRYRLHLDLAPDFTAEEIRARGSMGTGASSFGILCQALAARVGLEEIKDWTLPVLGVKGWKQAQCTGGGVLLEEVDLESMQSRRTEGLYLAGELLDLQGPCGGYNLQNAWESGRKAAEAIGRALGEERRGQPGT